MTELLFFHSNRKNTIILMVHCYVTETKVNAKLKTADSAVAPLQTTAGVLHQLIVQKPLSRESGSKVLSKCGKL